MQSLTALIQDILHFRFNSPLARRVLSQVYREGNDYTIHFGPLRGIKLKYEPTINFHAMLGLVELGSFKLLSKVLKNSRFHNASGCIWDVGANIGLYSSWFAKNLPQFQIHSFEPAPFARTRLMETLHLNQIKNVTVHSVALSDREGETEFFIGAHHHQSSLNADWAADGKGTAQKIVVPTLTMDAFYEQNRTARKPTLIKMDIEGGGAFALKGCEKLIRECSPLFWIESHSPEEDQAICNLLTRYSYEAFRLQTRTWVTKKEKPYPEKDGVWGDLFLCPSAIKEEFSKLIG